MALITFIKKVTFRKDERGLETVETAILLTLLMLLTFGVMEYGWMFFKIQQLNNVARVGARHAILPDATNMTTTLKVGSMMSSWGMGGSGYAVVITGDTTNNVSALGTGDLVTVAVSVYYSSIELLGMPLFPTPPEIRGTATMSKEGP